MRCLICACTSLVLLFLAGCDAVKSATDQYNPLVSFESRCENLPPAHVDIRPSATTVETNELLTLQELTTLGEDNPATHRTLGLTRTEIRREVSIELKGLKDAQGGRSCLRPQLSIEISMRPMTVYVASELRDNPCGRAVVLEHEMKHVAAFREHMLEMAQELGEQLPTLFGQRVVFAADPAAGEALVRTELQGFLRDFDVANAQALKTRQAAIDSPEEYARVGAACGGIRVE